jgi:cellulose synthase/poly-beta-1,6-N-acetylglucosamine synthase-like glycosyltransferase
MTFPQATEMAATMLSVFAIAMLVCSLVPAVLFCVNLRRYLPPPALGERPGDLIPEISVLIPARNEELSIAPAVASVLLSTGVNLEVVVMDDNSVDRTAEIVRLMKTTDDRVRVMQAPPLTAGWNGKQSACWALARAARFDLMCFMDADVRLEPQALARMAAFLSQENVALASGFPREVTDTWLEWMLLPLIHFVLLGFLPISRMRATTDPALSAGCGQFMLVHKEAYFASGGHAAIRATMHDGLLLPRQFRRHAYRTDLADLIQLATCRMYHSAAEVWHGLAKNATEGIGNPTRIVPLSALLIMGQVAPFAFAAWFVIVGGASRPTCLLIYAAVAAAWLPRVLAAIRFRQNWRGCILHPVGILLLLAVQWYALGRKLLGRDIRWKDRAYAGE